jgi:protein-ribulosamine 3-kinase
MNSLPQTLQLTLRDTLARLGDATPVESCREVSGGCINHASRLQTGRGIYFLKWNPDPLPGLFTTEAAGLGLLAATHTVAVPAVLAYGEQSGKTPAFLLLEWLEGQGAGSQARLGEQLAALHHASVQSQLSPQYGLGHDNYLGSTPQNNCMDDRWPIFFAHQRLAPQMVLCDQLGRLTPERKRRLERLIDRIPSLLDGVEYFPSLIHGDLWEGNVIDSTRGLAVIDPAVSYSDREAEIAYTELFGGFSALFYSAYQSVWRLQPGYSDRRDLYNLYHLLNHLNLFGESYAYQVDLVLRRFT